MKTIAIVAISAGVAVAAVFGILIGFAAYQEAQQQAQIEKETQAVMDLIEKVADEPAPTIQPPPVVEQKTTPPKSTPEPQQPSCDPHYPEFCIPLYPPDLDCGEIQYANFKVLQPDPHGFDRDKDGIGCES